MNNLRAGMAPPPMRMLGRPVDHRGYPVPWFVTEKDAEGRWDFRIVSPERREIALREKRCWVCGDRLGKFKSFVIGPMCIVNRTTAEPPVHLDCGEWSARVCPFMLLPRAKRRDANLPPIAAEQPGTPLLRNPGVVAVWTTRSFYPFHAGGSFLIHLGDPDNIVWFAEGRAATKAEVMASIESGAPALEELARAESPQAVAAYERQLQSAMALVPL